MSGHSHWSTIKRKKQSEDAKRSANFARVVQAIEVAVREGGNLKLAIEQAKMINMPAVRIENAIKRAESKRAADTGKSTEFGIFMPGNVVVCVGVCTDNKNRTTSMIRNIVKSFGGRLASPEAVEPYFELVGEVTIRVAGRGEEEILDLVVNTGAEDYVSGKGNLRIFTNAEELGEISARLRDAGEKILFSGFFRKVKLPVEDKMDGNTEKNLNEFVSTLKDNDEIAFVYTNYLA